MCSVGSVVVLNMAGGVYQNRSILSNLYIYLQYMYILLCSVGSVVVLNMAGGVYQNTVFGLAGRLPFQYTGALVLGSVGLIILKDLDPRNNNNKNSKKVLPFF